MSHILYTGRCAIVFITISSPRKKNGAKPSGFWRKLLSHPVKNINKTMTDASITKDMTAKMIIFIFPPKYLFYSLYIILSTFSFYIKTNLARISHNVPAV
jgi:hypothetical protein